ncbi:MAG TPA: hypothetical protein ENJ95_00150 [Bacteroidetes bacterium]|nr:hypothetical protein [Bacteroidota bacterium]
MKTRSFLLPLLFLFFSAAANAQFSFGIKGGYAKVWQSNTTTSADNSKFDGMVATVLLYRRVNKYLEIGIEPGYARRGNARHFNNNLIILGYIDFIDLEAMITPTDLPLVTQHIEVPLMIKSNIPLVNSKFIFLAKAGVGASWLASGYYESNEYDYITGQNISKITSLDFSNERIYKRWDWGIYAGTGIGYKLGFGMLAFEMETYLGQTSAVNFKKAKNRSINYSFSYLIDL